MAHPGFSGLLDLVAELGADPDALLAELNLERDHDPPPGAFQQALGLAARMTGRDEIGLLLARRRSLETLGHLAPLVGSAPTVGEAVAQLFEMLPSSFRAGARGHVERRGDEALLVGQVVTADPPALDQQADHLAGATVGLIRQLTRADWAPEAVYLVRRQPPDPTPYHRFFAAPVLFGQETQVMVVRSALLDAPVARANLALNRELFAQASRARADGLTGQVRDHIWRDLAGGGVEVASVATELGLPLRSLQRGLMREGTSFSALLDEARFEMARRLLRQSALSLAEISDSLGFAEPAVFTRFFARRAGLSPSAWRRQLVTPRLVLGVPRSARKAF